jgi:predicted cupin superfamily sugar epimerase
MASDRPRELIAQLGLTPHPEGGHFAETFRSTLSVAPEDGRTGRTALTAIYFLLDQAESSRWHRVTSDETWHWYEGEPLELLTFPPGGGEITVTVLGPLTAASTPMHVVRAGWWQAARPRGAYALVGCTVGPGFDFADFTMLADLPVERRPPIAPSRLLDALL